MYVPKWIDIGGPIFYLFLLEFLGCRPWNSLPESKSPPISDAINMDELKHYDSYYYGDLKYNKFKMFKASNWCD